MPGYSKWSPSLRSPHHKPVYISPLPNTCYMPRLSHSSRFDHPNNIWWGVQIIKLPLMYSSPPPCYLVPLRPTHLPYFQTSSAYVSPQCERPSFTPMHNNTQNYSSVYLNLYIFWQQAGRQGILRRIIPSIPWLQSFWISLWMELWFVRGFPKYLKCSTLSNDLRLFQPECLEIQITLKIHIFWDITMCRW
jgi:hypothetical protein